MFCGTGAGGTRALTGSGGTDRDVICSWPTCFLQQGPMGFRGGVGGWDKATSEVRVARRG